MKPTGGLGEWATEKGYSLGESSGPAVTLCQSTRTVLMA